MINQNQISAPFRSFWQAGYEGADHINHLHHHLSMNQATGHFDRARKDYQLLHQFGIRSVRETVGWRLVEHDGQFDFSSIETRAREAQELGLQICWTFCHYGWPKDIDVFQPQFIERFARLCSRLAEYLHPFTNGVPIYSPINEISFTSWGLSVHMFQCLNMHRENAGYVSKRQLVRATIAGCDAIWEVSPNARILQCDPLIHVAAPLDSPEHVGANAVYMESQFEAWDMLGGYKAPELGGAPRYLDILGANFYHSNQWESGTNLRLWWHLADPRRIPLHLLLVDLYERYNRPLLLAETSHVGSGRGVWIREMASEVSLAMQKGVDLRGICIYPAIDRPDWEDANLWHRSGLWDVGSVGFDPLGRILSPRYALALRQSQKIIEKFCLTNTRMGSQGEGNKMTTILVFSHLRWDFVYQRPQHLLSRLAQNYQIVFVEEPIFHEDESFLKSYIPAPNVTVYQPHTPISAAGFHDDQISSLLLLLEKLVPVEEEMIVWFCTPMALPLLPTFRPSLIVYDSMDELAAFKNSPKQLLQRESALLTIADVVFTGGRSLYEAKRKRHPNVHCLPSSVDVIHFEQALDRTNTHPAQVDIGFPRLGFYGVIDERLDTRLILALAEAHIDWQIVLVDPIVKIDPAGFGLTCEITYSPGKPLPVDGKELIARCVNDCIAVGMLLPDDEVLVATQVDMPYAYVVYDHARAANVATVRAWLTEQDIVLAGRYSEWEYYNSDHAFLAGKKAAESLHSLQFDIQQTELSD
jgi:UDP-galactopyranose mutase